MEKSILHDGASTKFVGHSACRTTAAGNLPASTTLDPGRRGTLLLSRRRSRHRKMSLMKPYTATITSSHDCEGRSRYRKGIRNAPLQGLCGWVQVGPRATCVRTRDTAFFLFFLAATHFAQKGNLAHERESFFRVSCFTLETPPVLSRSFPHPRHWKRGFSSTLVTHHGFRNFELSFAEYFAPFGHPTCALSVLH